MKAKSVGIVVAIVGYNHCHTSRHRIKEALDVSLRQSSLYPCGFQILPKLIWCSSGWCIPGQSLYKYGPHVIDWRKFGKTSMTRKQFNLMGSLEYCVPRVVAHYPFGIWRMTSAECMGGPWTPTPQRRNAGCSVYRQCVLEGCGSEIQYHSKP
ncbi:hypothetical protein TNCV_2400531 [Trichonephila clavipes]|nr:hypothetical protein TNCV_2400531 [Trichonephila clavipes]